MTLCNLVAGDSFSAMLDEKRLGKGKKRTLNISRGGAKIADVGAAIDQFYVDNDEYRIDTVFVSIGANDIRYCKEQGVKHLRGPLINLVKKIKGLFPEVKIYLQSVIPLPIVNIFTAKNVINLNNLIYDICCREKVYFLNVFYAFLGHHGRRNAQYFTLNPNNCHPNKIGTGVLARFYIERIHSRRFNPYGY